MVPFYNGGGGGGTSVEGGVGRSHYEGKGSSVRMNMALYMGVSILMSCMLTGALNPKPVPYKLHPAPTLLQFPSCIAFGTMLTLVRVLYLWRQNPTYSIQICRV